MAKITLRIRQGKTFRKTMYWYRVDAEGTVTGIDMTNCTARAQIRETLDSETPLHELTTENDGITLGNLAEETDLVGSGGTTVTLPVGTAKIDFFISAEDSAAFAITGATWKGLWELEIQFPTTEDVESPIDVSSVIISREVTR